MARFKKAPSHYPLIPLGAIGLVRGLCALAVVFMMAFFIYHLKKDPSHEYPIPTTFILLLTAGIFSFIFSAFKIFAICFGLNPIFSLITNLILLALWTAGCGSLAYFAGHTLINACDVDNWGQEGTGGHIVCRVYKAVFATSFLAWFATICAVFVDGYVRRKQNALGRYQRMGNGGQKGLLSHEDDPWSTELHPSPQPYQQGRYEPMGAPAGLHTQHPSKQRLSNDLPSYDTGYHGASQGAAGQYYDLHDGKKP